MSPRSPRAGWPALLSLLLVSFAGCSGANQVVRLDTGEGRPLVHVPRGGPGPVALRRSEFKAAVAELGREVRPAERPVEAARRLFEVPERGGWYGYTAGKRRLFLLEEEQRLRLELSPEAEEMKRQYLWWCGRTWGPGDCLGLLVNSPSLDGEGRYVLAMAMAQGAVLREMKEALGEMVDARAVMATVASAGAMYMLLWAMPEPLSKGVAATLTLGLIAYLGVDTVWRLIGGWLELMEKVERASTFEELRGAGEKYGEVMGETAARAFVMLATVAVGNTAAGVATKLPTLPGAGQAALVAEAQLGVRYRAVAQVEAVAVTAEGVTIALAANAVAMTARGMGAVSAGAWRPPHGGPGQWVQVNESMSERARGYQAQVTGAPEGHAYRVKVGNEEVDFDGFEAGVLLEAKGEGYAQFIDDEMLMKDFFKGAGKMLDQAERQFKVARGTPIRWIVAEEKLASALRRLFAKHELDIEVVHVPPLPRGGAAR